MAKGEHNAKNDHTFIIEDDEINPNKPVITYTDGFPDSQPNLNEEPPDLDVDAHVMPGVIL